MHTIKGRVPKLVVLRPLSIVGEDLVGFLDLNKLLTGVLLLIGVRVIFLGELAWQDVCRTRYDGGRTRSDTMRNGNRLVSALGYQGCSKNVPDDKYICVPRNMLS